MYQGTLVRLAAASLTAASAAGMTFTAQAEEPDRRFCVAPMASYAIFDDDTSGGTTLELDDGIGATLAIGKPLGSMLNVELYGFIFDGVEGSVSGGTTGSGEADIEGYGIDFLYFPVRDTFPIFGIVGYAAGTTEADFFGNSDPSVGDTDNVDVGLGYLWQLNDYGLSLRGEYRYRSTEIDSGGVEDFDAEERRHRSQRLRLDRPRGLAGPGCATRRPAEGAGARA